MSRYIDAEEAYKVITEAYPLLQKGMLKKVIGSIPTAEEVKRGRWEHYLNVGLRYKCSICGSRYTVPYHYCPNCGAKMDEVGE